jgi:hypothetical protein
MVRLQPNQAIRSIAWVRLKPISVGYFLYAKYIIGQGRYYQKFFIW